MSLKYNSATIIKQPSSHYGDKTSQGRSSSFINHLFSLRDQYKVQHKDTLWFKYQGRICQITGVTDWARLGGDKFITIKFLNGQARTLWNSETLDLELLGVGHQEKNNGKYVDVYTKPKDAEALFADLERYKKLLKKKYGGILKPQKEQG